jgi:DNA-binding CsgD family transcriptional regulator
MDIAAAMFQVVGVLREAQHSDGHVLRVEGVADGLLRILPAEELTLNDLDLRHHQEQLLELLDTDYDGEYPGQFWDHFLATPSSCYTEQDQRLRREVMRTSDFYTDRQWHSTGMYSECFAPSDLDQVLIMPLPAPAGIARRLAFIRSPRWRFSDTERDAAVLLQPHIAEALRLHARRSAAQLLTVRQLQLLQMVALGYDNSAIARRWVVSPSTVRKHLENINARLGVTSRTAAVARAFPDITWS